MVWICLPFIRSGQDHLARNVERGKMTRQTEEEMGRQQQGMGKPEVCQVPEGSGEQRKMEETGCEVICGSPMTLAVKGQVKVKVILAFFCLNQALLFSFCVMPINSMNWTSVSVSCQQTH